MDVKPVRAVDTQYAKFNFIIVSPNPKSLPPHLWELAADSEDNKIINFYTTNMDELAIIAKYRIMPMDTLITIQGGKVVHRVVGTMPTVEGLSNLINL